MAQSFKRAFYEGKTDGSVTLRAMADRMDREWISGCVAIYRYDGVGYLVLLPDGVQPGDQVRVLLAPLKKDKNGKQIFTSIPAPPRRHKSWWANGDDTESLFEAVVDWRLERIESGPLDTRPIGRKPRWR